MWANWRERRPGQTLAFMAEADAELLAETLVAFANSDGGTILIGVDEAGQFAGRVYPDEVELEDENQPIVLPSWVGQEISSDPKYFNANLK